MTLKILIAGGYGLVGSWIARHLRAAHPDVELLIGGRNPDRGEALAAELGHARAIAFDAGSADAAAVGSADLVIAALHDKGDRLVQAAMDAGAAHIGITRTAGDIAPAVFATQFRRPPRPVVLLGHWQAGILTLAALDAARAFARVDTISMAALFDMADPIGPMTEGDADSFMKPALIRTGGLWQWVDAPAHARSVLFGGDRLDATPIGVLDVPSVAAVTRARNVRFDLAIGTSAGTRAGGPASHDLQIDIEGELHSGAPAARRLSISAGLGQAHLTALGVSLIAERVLGLDGVPPPAGGLHLPETLLDPAAVMRRLETFGVSARIEAIQD